MVLPAQRPGTSTAGEKRGWGLFDFLLEDRPGHPKGRAADDDRDGDAEHEARRDRERHPGGRAEAWQRWRQLGRQAGPDRRAPHAPPHPAAVPAQRRAAAAPLAYRPPSGPALFSDEERLRRLIARCRLLKSRHARKVLVYCLALQSLHTPNAHDLDIAI